MNRISLLCVLTLAVSACNDSKVSGALVQLTDVSMDTKCPHGGTLITAGNDDNANGTLDEAEVKQTTEVCNGPVGAAGPTGSQGTAGMNGTAGQNGGNGTAGPNGRPALASTSEISVGDSRCPNGGVKVDFGIDDGAGGGTSGDGVLQSGEVSATRIICNGAAPRFPGSFTVPAGDAGTLTIDTTGGAGTTANGGQGGSIGLGMSSGSLGGHVKVFATGSIDAGFVLPLLTFTPGSAPLRITSDFTLQMFPSLEQGVDAGVTAFSLPDSTVHFADGGLATSLDVAAGKTLTLGGPVTVANDLQVAGTINTTVIVGSGGTGDARRPLSLRASNISLTSSSSIDVSGSDPGGATAGASGASVELHATRYLVAHGSIVSNGGGGVSGGRGGTVRLTAEIGELYQTGTIRTLGGAGSASGGSAGDLYLQTYVRGIFNSGRLSAEGGAGAASGGAGGFVRLSAEGDQLRHTGAISTVGGTCTGATCIGGSGGDVSVTSLGQLIITGSITASGAAGVAGGGNGRNIELNAGNANEGSAKRGANGPAQFGGNANLGLPSGSMVVSGQLTTTGGTGQSGGRGGTVSARLSGGSLPTGQEMTFYGYSGLLVRGGVSTSGNGGNGGAVYLANSVSYTASGQLPGGGVVLASNVDLRGGDGAQGGQGGQFYASTQTDFNFGDPNEVVRITSASIDARGGSSAAAATSGALGGYVEVEGTSGMSSSANVDVSAGSATASGAHGGEIMFFGDWGAITNSGALTTNGGATSGTTSTDVGGQGGLVSLEARAITNSGALTAHGGAGAHGGNGGRVNMTATAGAGTVNTGALDVSGGTGGVKGNVVVDGNDVTP